MNTCKYYTEGLGECENPNCELFMKTVLTERTCSVCKHHSNHLVDSNNMVSQLLAHVAKAKAKHPKEAEKMFHDIWAFDPDLRIESLIEGNDLREEKNCSSYNLILEEEILEAYYAHEKGNTEAFIDECYDAMAVLWRMVEKAQAEGAKK